MELKTVLYSAENSIATVTMNRPEVLNALDAQLGADLGAALRSASADAAVRVVLLTGAGRAFCSGGDIKSMAAGLATASTTPYDLGALLRNFHDVVAYLHEMDKPVVAAVHGPAVGAGMSLALACDLRIAAEDSTFSQAFIRIGLSPDGGSTWLLPRAVGPARAAFLTMTGETLDARRALEWGIVNEVVPAGQDLSRATELARQLAGYSPYGLAALKRLLRASGRNSFREQLEAEASAQAANAGTAEFRAAVAAFLARK